MRTIIKSAALLTLLCLVHSATAGTVHWTNDNSTDNEWSDTSRWSNTELPGTTTSDNAVLSGGDTVNVTSDYTAANSTILSIRSSSLASGTASLTIGADMSNITRLDLAANGQDKESTVIHTNGLLQVNGDISIGTLDGATGVYLLSDTAGSISMSGLVVGGGGSFSIMGSDVSVKGTSLTLNSGSELSFILGVNGASTIDVTGAFSIDALASLIIDASAITSEGSFNLVNFGTISEDKFADIDITGLTGNLTGSVSYDGNSLTLDVVPEPATIAILGLGSMLLILFRRMKCVI